MVFGGVDEMLLYLVFVVCFIVTQLLRGRQTMTWGVVWDVTKKKTPNSLRIRGLKWWL